MAAVLDIPVIEDVTAFHLERWKQVCTEPALLDLAERVETNRYGQIVMMPPPGFAHANFQFEIGHRLKTLMSGGRTLTECAVLTSDGVKGADVAWISERRVKRGLKSDVLTIAPEICVGVVSPGNTCQQMEGKRDLYFEAGADEVWFCDKQGALAFFLKDRPNTRCSVRRCRDA